MTLSRIGSGARVAGSISWVLSPSGGTVVHISSGVSALVAAMMLGERLRVGPEGMVASHGAMPVLGASLLWFGFNAGSVLTYGALANSAFVNTNTAPAMGELTWMTVSWAVHRQPSVLGAAGAAVAGLVAITPAPGYVIVLAAILIGFGAGIICFFDVRLKERLGVDDALDVFAVL